jgi:pSer/pThr/pTyr-binding forkhead associated (FHA) protein
MAEIPVLVATTGILRGTVIRVTDSADVSFGRADDNQVVLQEKGISRYHARFRYDNGTLWIQDAGSRNGVFVNDKRVTDHRTLKVGDEVAIAGQHFEVRWEDETLADADTPRSPASQREKEVTTAEVEAPKQKGKSWFWPFG